MCFQKSDRLNPYSLGDRLLESLLTIYTKPKNTKHAPIEAISSLCFGGIISRKPWPLINDEKLETQNGIANNLSVCQ